MAVKRRPLPYKVVDRVNMLVLREYRKVATAASENIRKLLINAVGAPVTADEAALRNLEKSVGGRAQDMPMFDRGEQVQIQMGDNWVPAEVVSTAGVLKVCRSDGSVRNITDLTKVMKNPGQSIGAGIVLKEMDVRIPEGTKSFEIETVIKPITERMNRSPLVVNAQTWDRNLRKSCEKLAELNAKCVEITGNLNFNPNSPKDCTREFAVLRGFNLGRVSATGVASVDKEALQHIANMGDPLAPVVIAAREERSRNSQLKSWAPFAKDGLVQTNWDQFGQPHGRYTSDNPNLQNRVVEIRETVESKPGHSLLSADWGMAEYVTWASLSKDVYLSKIIESGRDLHAEMGKDLAIAVPNRNLGGVDVRKFGKTVNFALLYRMQSWTLAKSLGVSTGEADQVMVSYFQRAPQATKYINDCLTKAALNGYVETAFGRRLYCLELASLTGPQLKQLQKTVWHHHNAGTAAELLKLKMIETEQALRKNGLSIEDASIVMNMHDEMILEVEDSKLDQVSSLLYDVMSKQVEGFLPFSVDVRVGKNWLEISK